MIKMNRYKLQELITDDLFEAEDWVRKNGEELTRDDIERVFNETVDSAFTYWSDVLSLWDDFGSPEPSEMLDTIEASILHATIEALHYSDVLANAVEDAELSDVWDA